MKINVQSSFDKVKFDEGKEIHLVVSLVAPKMEWQKKRPPICVVPVIDVSGSMSGAKLEYAKQSIMKLIDHLQPGDYCGLVAFESSVYAIAEPMEMTQSKKDELKKKVGEMRPMGGTNFAGGMVQALSYLSKMDLKGGTILRIIMFTDGQANEGVHDPEGLKRLLKANIGSASMSCFGFGNGCDQELLATLSKEGQGNYAFISNPDQALTAFAKELGGLLSTYAQNIVVDLAPHNGHEFTDVVSDVDSEEDGKKVKIKLRDILSEEVRQLVVALKLSPQTKALPRPMNVADVVVIYDLLNEKGELEHRKEEVKSKIEFVKAGEEQDKPTKEVDAIVAQAQVVQKQIEAEEQALKGNYRGAQLMMMDMAREVDLRGFHGLGNIATKTSGHLSSHANYTAGARYLRSSTKGLSRGMGLSYGNDEAMADLESVGVACCNAAQTDTVGSFIGDASGGGGTVDAVGNVLQSVAGSIIVPQSVVQASKKPEPSKSSLSKKRSKRW